MKNFKKAAAVIMTLVLTLCINATVFAAAPLQEESNTATLTVEPRGSLSGYGHRYVNSWENAGNFTVNVSGSGSPWAGCTFKTEGFSSSDGVTLTLLKPDGGQAHAPITVNGSGEVQFAFLFAGTGNYTVKYGHHGGTAGTIHCYIY